MNNDTPPTHPSDEDTFGTIRRPMWDQCQTIQHTRLWHAVALACNLDPGNYQQSGKPKLAPLFKELPTEFTDLLSDAKRDIRAKGILKPVSINATELEESEINLSNFATWLKSIGYQTPDDFPWQPEAISFINTDWPWGRHETKLLRKMAEAAQKFWSHYDPSDPTTAPTNQQVIDWLVKHDVAKRTAETMATILRADGLSTGPRK